MLAPLNFELKLLVDPARALESNGAPTRAVQTALKIDGSKEISMQFVDGARLELREVQWNVRIRAFSDHDKLQLTYKKRYAIDPNDSISATLARARQDGYDADPATYESQIEWGRDSKTLTLSMTTDSAQRESNPIDLPGERQSREVCMGGGPFRLDHEQSQAWVRGVLLHAHVYGPVHGKRWLGELAGKKLSMEVWNIRGAPGMADERVVEVSVKEDDSNIAEARFGSLFDFLNGKGWLQDRAALKTDMILKRY